MPAAGSPELEFPVKWTFRLIVESGRVREAAAEFERIFASFGLHPELAAGCDSATGRYRTLLAPVTIPSRRVFDELPTRLGAVGGVRMVI